jgi:hypothetical protein
VGELSNADASGKTLFPELFAEHTRFVIHLVTLRAVAWDRPRATPQGSVMPLTVTRGAGVFPVSFLVGRQLRTR